MVRAELTRVEAGIALCRLCFGPEPRLPARIERPPGRGRILLLGERPARAALEREERIGLSARDSVSAELRRRVADAGIRPGEIIVGAAVLCLAADRDVEQAVPAARCATACVVHVRELVRAAQPRLIVPLGATALRSLRSEFPEQPRLARLRFPASVGHTAVAGGTFIHPLYHVAARARTARPEARQREDWQALGRLWDWIRSGEPGPLPAPGCGAAATVDTPAEDGRE